MKRILLALALLAALSAVNAQSTDSVSNYYRLTHGGYDKLNYRVLVGYVNKSYICTYPEHGTQTENIWGEPNRYFHGFQVGALYTPSFDWGLGLRTGGAVEVYISDRPWMDEYCNYYYEMDLYIPVHAFYRIPFTMDCALTVYGGAAFQWALGGRYVKNTSAGFSFWRGIYVENKGPQQQYGVDGFPKAVNWQAECGLEFRIKNVMLGFTYSFGLNNHNLSNTFDGGATYIDATKSRQDKMQATISFNL